MDDLKPVFDIITARDITLYGAAEPGNTLEELRHSWQSPGHNLETDSWVVLSPAGNIIATVGVWHRQYILFYAHPNIHPRYTGLGIGLFLLQLAEKRARQYLADAPSHARITLHSWASSIDKTGQHRLQQEGFTRVRSSWRMEIEMQDTPPQPQWPQGIVVRALNPGQEERAVFAASDEAFRDHWGHISGDLEQWKHWTVERPDFDPSLWFLACEGNEIAGISLCEYQAEDLGWVNDLAVRRPWRRKGLGMALLHHSFGEFYRRGIRKVGLEVDSQNLTGATRLYERVGMHSTRQYDSYEKELRSGIELTTQSLPA
jgi:mycothiol synthase